MIIHVVRIPFAGGDHAGLPPPEHCADARQLPGRGRALGRHGVPGGRRTHGHRHARQVRIHICIK